MFFPSVPANRRRPSLVSAAGCLLLLLTTAILGGPPLQARQPKWATSHFRGHVIRVEAGDRIVARLQTIDFTVRLHGITCPTSPPEAGEKARAYAARRVLDTDVEIAVHGTAANQTVYGEVIEPDKQSLNQELVRVGLAAWANTYAPNRADLSALQQQAQIDGVGIWSDPTAANVALPSPNPTPTAKRAVVAPKPSAKPAVTEITAPPIPPPHRIAATPRIAPTQSRLPSAPIPGPAIDLAPTGTPAGDPRLWLLAIFGGLTVALTIASGSALGFSSRRFLCQLAISALGAASITLLLPLFSGAVATGHSQPGYGVIALLPPVLILCAWAAITLPRREQILRGAAQTSIQELTGGDTLPPNRSLVRLVGNAAALPDQAPILSRVGAIPAIYLHEVTQIYQASAQSAGQPQRSRRYAWQTIADETRAADFQLAADEGQAAVVVEAERAQFRTGRIAHFYNEVPVERWFARPYPGDTRTEVTYIGRDAPIVAWGRPRRAVSPVDGRTETRLGYDGASEILVVAEGDGSVVWTRRPILGLLLTLVTICLAVGLAFIIASTPLPTGPPSRHTFSIGEAPAILCFWFGAFSLVGLIRAARAGFAAEQQFHQNLAALDTAFERRRDRVFALFSRDDALVEAANRAERSQTARDRILSEIEVGSRIQRLIGGGSMPIAPTARLEDVRAELRQLQTGVFSAAVRYNEASGIMDFLRRRFPTALFLRAREASDPVLYDSA